MRCSAWLWCVAGCLALTGAASASDWRLAGTVQVGPGAVVLETPDGQRVLRVGEQAGDCRLDAVSRKAATFICDTTPRTLRLGARLGDEFVPHPAPAILQSATVQIAKKEVRTRIANRQQLVGELALEPLTGAEGIEGYRLREVAHDSMAARVGLEADDILRGVNGVPVSAGSAFMQLVNQLGDANQVEIEIERAGRRLQTLILLN